MRSKLVERTWFLTLTFPEEEEQRWTFLLAASLPSSKTVRSQG
jgi:hypothetical protein